MDRQTDGTEWVLATMFVIAMLAVVAAAIREIKRARSGDPGGEPASPRGKGGAGRNSAARR
ncbi:MAG: hypothetical protein U0167_15595 [bacterium]